MDPSKATIAGLAAAIAVLVIVIVALAVELAKVTRVARLHKDPACSLWAFNRLKDVVVAQTTASNIPKVLWTYWITDDDPVLNRACRASWKWFNPEFEIRDVRRSTLAKYLPDLAELLPTLIWLDCPAKESDIVRVHLIEQYGGVWMDATILCYGPLPFKAHLEDPTCTFVGYKTPWLMESQATTTVEAWCFAAPKGHKFVALWRTMLMAVNDHGSIEAYLHHIYNHLGFPYYEWRPAYLLLNIVGRYIYSEVLTPAERTAMHLLPDTDPRDIGPRADDVRVLAIAKEMSAIKRSADRPPGMLKFTSDTRTALAGVMDIVLAGFLPEDMPFAVTEVPCSMAVGE